MPCTNERDEYAVHIIKISHNCKRIYILIYTKSCILKRVEYV